MNTKEHMELHPENLRSLADVPPEERKRIQSNGGKKGAETKRRIKMMSTVYSKFLSHRYNIKVDGEVKSLSGEKMLLEVIGAIIMRKDSASVAMQHEIRETLEGNNINLSGNLNQTVMPADRLAAFRDLKSQADETIAEQEEPDVDSPTE